MKCPSAGLVAMVVLSMAVASAAWAAEPGQRSDSADEDPGLVSAQLLPFRPAKSILPRSSLTRAGLADPQFAVTPVASQTPSFQSQHPLLGRISASIERAGLSSPIELANEPLAFTQNRNRGVLRAAKKAIKGFLLEDMDFYRPESESPSVTEVRVEDSRAVRVHFGFARLAPKVNLQCRAGEGTVGFSLSARGSAGIDINTGAGDARLHLGYDHRSKTSAVALRLAF